MSLTYMIKVKSTLPNITPQAMMKEYDNILYVKEGNKSINNEN